MLSIVVINLVNIHVEHICSTSLLGSPSLVGSMAANHVVLYLAGSNPAPSALYIQEEKENVG